MLPESGGEGCDDEVGGAGEVLLPESDGAGDVGESPPCGGGVASGDGGGGESLLGGVGDGLLPDGGGDEDASSGGGGDEDASSGGGGDVDVSVGGGDVDVSDGGGELSDDILTIPYSSEENDRANPYLSPKLMTL